MDIVSGVVVILLVLLSGAVAALGDWLGRRLGKKRLRIGKLRPKHTAIVTTFFAGMFITLVTIVSLSLLSDQVRKWLVEGADVQRQLQEAKQDLTSTEGLLRSSRTEIAGVREELRTEREKLAAEQAKVAQATRDAEEMRREATGLRAQVATLEAQVKESTEDLQELRAEYKRVDELLRQQKGNIDEFVRQREELIRENNELLATNDKLGQDIDRMQREIATLNQSMASAKTDLATAKQNFEREKELIEAERSKAINALNDAQGQLNRVRGELNLLQNQALQLLDDSRRSRVSPLIYSRGDELARLPVRSMLSQAEARNYLLAVIELASRDALSRGAVESETSNSAAGFLGYRTNDGTQVTAEMLFQQAVQKAAAKEDDQLLVVRTLFNSFRGDWIAIEIDVVPNRVVYAAGDFIIETRIDGRLGVQGATEALVGFIRSQLRDRAVNDGMVPAHGRATELGEVTQEQIQQIVGDIVATGRTITVRFHAAKETRAGDTLELDIRLR